MTDSLTDWLLGDLSPTARVFTALAPALLASAYFLAGLALFSVRTWLKGMPRDAETEKRGATILVGPFLRHYFFWVTRPFWRLLLASGLPATGITTLSVLVGLGAGVAVAAGRFALGGWLFLVAGILDTMDGRLARSRNQATPAGAAIDSVLDRYTDAAILIGLAWYYRHTWVLLPVLAAFVGSSQVPYVRARGEGLGVAVRGGMMQRLERVLFLGVTVAVSPVLEALMVPDDKHPMHWVAVAGVCFVAVTSNFTALSRFFTLVRALAPEPAGARPLASQLGLNVLAAAVATGLDFLVVLQVVSRGWLTPGWATVLGCIVGALVNFAMNRTLTFQSRAGALAQLGRYAFVAATSAGLNGGGVWLLGLHGAVDYRWAWWVVRGTVFLAWNFPLHRSYVFAPPLAPEPGHAG